MVCSWSTPLPPSLSLGLLVRAGPGKGGGRSQGKPAGAEGPAEDRSAGHRRPRPLNTQATYTCRRLAICASCGGVVSRPARRREGGWVVFEPQHGKDVPFGVSRHAKLNNRRIYVVVWGHMFRQTLLRQAGRGRDGLVCRGRGWSGTQLVGLQDREFLPPPPPSTLCCMSRVACRRGSLECVVCGGDGDAVSGIHTHVCSSKVFCFYLNSTTY